MPSEELYKTIFNCVNDGIFVVDANARILDANKSACDRLGRSRSELIGLDAQELNAPESVPLVHEHVRRVFADGRFRYETTHLAADGRRVHVEVDARRIDFDGRPAALAVVRDITERKAILKTAEEKAKKSQNEWKAIFQAIGHPSVILDPDHKVVAANSAILLRLGKTEDELIGKYCYELFHGPDLAETPASNCPMRSMISQGNLTTVEMELEALNGNFLVSCTPVLDDQGRLQHVIHIATDITERKRMENDLLRTKEAAETANRAKSEFLANMSHELRTPLNAVIGFASLLQECDLVDPPRKWVGIVKNEGEHLLSIINDILDLARIEADHLELSTEVFSLRDCIKTLFDSIASSAREKPLSLEWEVHDDVPDELLGDPLRLRQILANLLGNAVKFTERGVIRLVVDTNPSDPVAQGGQEPVEESGHTKLLRFVVSDTGVGIPKHLQEKVFNPFIQADGSYTRRYGGTGLGLAICRRLVERMGGSIGLSSEEGKGSVFTFTSSLRLPSKNGGTAAGQSTAGYTSEESTKKRKYNLLVVEDNVTNASLLQEILSLEGHTSTITWTGMEALDAMKSDCFDAVLLDVHIPDINGFELVAKIRERERSNNLKATPFIAVTAHAMKGDRERCLKAGMDAYVPKPIDRDLLVSTINTLLEPKR